MTALSGADFEFVRRMVREDSAISLDDGKDYLVQARLAPVAAREGLASVSDLVGRLRTGRPGLRDDVVEAMTTNETSFFRDVAPFDALRDHILPTLAATERRPLALWSAAAATGQEAYSLAMLVRERLPTAVDPTILATDLSRDVLERARAGRYNQLEVNRGLPARMLVKYFERDGTAWQLKEAIRRLVTFRQLNLARPWPLLPAMDVVLLRNVLIYFDVPAKRTVLAQVARVLRPGGYLFLGSAETTFGLDTRYERLEVAGAVCYRLAERGA